MKFSFTVFASSLLLGVNGQTDQGRDDFSGGLQTREILLAMFDATGGFDWLDSTNWFQQRTNACDWYGITCFDETAPEQRKVGHIREINLKKNHLVGTIPADVFQLPYLEVLAVQDNPDLDVNFASLSSAQFLIEMGISNTQVSNIDNIGEASNLEVLHMSDLGLKGEIPTSLFDLEKLRSLFGNFNSFSGSLSTRIGRLTSLQEIYLTDSDLTGQIPSQIALLTNLEILTLQQNAFGGSLPTEMNRMSNLRVIAIQREDGNGKGDGVSGSVPSFPDNRRLNALYLENQKFNGQLDSDFLLNAPTGEAVTVDLSNNQLTGGIPSSLSSKQFLTLYLAENEITSVPSGIFDASSDSCPDITNWMNGDVRELGCDAFLCPPGTSAPEGRSSKEGNCQACSDDNQIWGRTNCDSSTPSDVKDREVLIQMYNDMGGRSWKEDENWLNLDVEVCQWYGIGCNQNGRVTSIDLRNNGLSGTPPQDLFLLGELKDLYFESNAIQFVFNGIGSLSSLETLDLSSTGLPSLDGLEELSSLPNLRFLSLASNNLGGSIPEKLFGLTSLEELDISHNSFTGQLSAIIGDLTTLKRFKCNVNKLTGQLPSQIGLLAGLEEFSAQGNAFGGSLPTQFELLSNLRTLALQQTSSEGGIGGPLLSFRDLNQLTSLKLDSNKLTGTLPTDFLANSANLDSRIVVGLSDNLLEGSMPGQWSRFDRLDISLGGNKITSIDSSLCNKEGWNDQDVKYYKCNGILCEKGTYNAVGRQSDDSSACQDCSKGTGGFLGAKSCGNSGAADTSSELSILKDFFSSTNGVGWSKKDGWEDQSNVCNFYGVECSGGSVSRIALTDNGMRGTVSTRIFELSQLQELNLSGNSIMFQFDGISKAERLTTLYLKDTNLDSLAGIGDAPNLATLDIADNSLRGEIPYEIFLLTTLRDLNLGFNLLSGKIPNIISALSNLEALYLHHNQFDGALPAALGDLRNLRILNLAENNFEGTIPQDLNRLTNLQFLSLQREGGISGDIDVGINQGDSSALGPGLTGTLPAFDGLSAITQLFLGVNSLSGSIPYNFLDGVTDKSSPIQVDITSNRLSGTIPAALTQFAKMSLYVADNRITGIASGICNQPNWMGGAVALYQCDAILCPENTYNAIGRKGAQENTCQTCSSATNGYLGGFECLSEEDHLENSERAILEQLYKKMGGEKWLKRTNWMDTEETICMWYGVTCTSDGTSSVASIKLPSNRLVNQFPTEIYQLPNLQTLDLQGNKIQFSFDGVENAGQLGFLNLEETGLDSLAGIEAASSLKVLRIGENEFETFPQEVLGFTNLEVLSMSGNALPPQTFPTQFQSFANLVHFSCSGCGFTGAIPTYLGSLVNLEYLALDQNGLVGWVPTELNSLTKLSHLDLSDQISAGGGLTGNVRTFASLTQLREIYLQHNNFQSPIPEGFLGGIATSELVTVDLSYNALTGAIPTSLAAINNLNLYVAMNNLTSIPQQLCNNNWNEGNTAKYGCDGIACPPGKFNAFGRAVGDLQCFSCDDADATQFFGSKFCGTGVEHTTLIALYRATGGPNWKSDINWLRAEDHCTWEGITCHEDGEFKGLVKEVNLEDNNLVSTLPFSQIWMLEGMESLNLRKNDIDIPFAMVSNAKNLMTVQLSETNTMSLHGIGAATSLKSVHITNAQVIGLIPEDLFDLTSLEELYLSHNQLMGPLFTSIGKLTKIKDLYLFANELTGPLPSELGLLASVEHLSLGENDFTGNVPAEMEFLPRLEMLSLQSEKPADPDGFFSSGSVGLTGTVPPFIGLPRIREIYLGHNSFTGQIPSNFLQSVDDKSSLIVADLSYNAIEGAIPASLAVFDDLQLNLASNNIHEIPDEICAKKNWMNGEVASSCDAILCPPETFNEFGRQVDSKTLCNPCTYPGSSISYGSTECGPVFADNMDDTRILHELYDATGGSNWANSDGWKNDKVAFCEWYGIHCEPIGELGQMTVTEINLSENNLDGVIPSIIYHLPKLQKLDFRSNEVEMGFFAIFQAETLTELYLDQTRVSSLDGIGRALSLKTLHLHKNSFGWEKIPDELFGVTTLEELKISESMLSGSLSSNIGNLTSLRTLSLAGNRLSGQIPPEIGQLQSLEELELSNNNWFGRLPESVNGMASLKALFVENVKGGSAGLSGPLPPFTGMPLLRELHLSQNQFTGTISSSFLADVSDPDAAIKIRLAGNQLVGTIPSQLSALRNINIDLTDNVITGIADELCEMTNWQDGAVSQYGCDAILCPPGYFSAQGRQTDGSNQCELCPGAESSPYFGVSFCLSIQKKKEKEILKKLYSATNGGNWINKEKWLDDAFDVCEWYGIECSDGSSVESVLLGRNHLDGTIPKEIFELPNLKFLWLYSNPVHFSFDGIAQATSLRSLLLDSTRLSSLDGIGRGVSLTDVDIRFNNLKGRIPKEIENLVNLQSFTCSSNAFTGKVPELTALANLNTLRMGKNKLTGTLPSFSRHPVLKALDLSENNLKGSIPTKLLETASAQQAVFLDISENQLTGTIPGDLARFSDLTIYARENLIEGIDPGLCSQEAWNQGDVATFQCDGILCPSGTFSPTGRASRSGATCSPCDKNDFFGGTACGKKKSAASSPMQFGVTGLFSLAVLTAINLALIF